MNVVSFKIDENDKKQAQELKEAEKPENLSPKFNDIDKLMESLDA